MRCRKHATHVTLPLLLALLLCSCQASPKGSPSPAATGSPQGPAGITTLPSSNPTPATPAPQASASPALTAAPTLACPQTIVFYGDSRLGNMGVSFVENIKGLIDPCYSLVSAAFWAHTAQWGSANLQEEVIARHPDIVALWWGANDFNDCNGTTDPDTDQPDQAKFNAHLETYLAAMKAMIETLAGLGKPVYVFDEPRVDGGRLPWAIEDSNGNVLSYDHNHLCAWDWVSDAVAAAQKQLVADEAAAGKQVFLVDVWQLYMDEGTLPDMYSTDVVHPGSLGREKIAELFMQVFQANAKP